MRDFASPSTGNMDKDEEIARKFEERSRRIAAGECPNGCGGMREVDSHNAECLKCGFQYYSASPINFKLGTIQ